MTRTRQKIMVIFLLSIAGCTSSIPERPIFSPSQVSTAFQISAIPIISAEPTISVNPTYENPIYASMDKILVLNPNEWTVYNTETSGVNIGEIHDIAFGPDGAVWFASLPFGLIKYQNGIWQNYDPGNDYSIRYIAIAGNGNVWVVSDDLTDELQSRIGYFDGVSWTFFPEGNNKLHGIVVSQDGLVYFSGEDGIEIFDGKTWSGMAMNGYLAESPDGTMWISHLENSQSGLYYLLENTWEQTPYTTDYFFPELIGEGGSGMFSIPLFASDGSFWLRVTQQGLLHIFQNGDWKFFPNQILTSQMSFTTDTIVSKNGIVWFGGFYGIASFDGEEWAEYQTSDPPGIARGIVWSIAESSDGEIWFGGTGCIYSYNPE